MSAKTYSTRVVPQMHGWSRIEFSVNGRMTHWESHPTRFASDVSARWVASQSRLDLAGW